MASTAKRKKVFDQAFFKRLVGRGAKPHTGAKRPLGAKRKIKIQHKQPPLSFFGSIPKNGGDKFLLSKRNGKTRLKPRVQSRLTNLLISITTGRDCTRAIFRVRCPKNRPHLSKTYLNRRVKPRLTNPKFSLTMGRGFTRAISAVRCRRNR